MRKFLIGGALASATLAAAFVAPARAAYVTDFEQVGSSVSSRRAAAR
jgi:hypothetical protein